jgi:hypothetical protein
MPGDAQGVPVPHGVLGGLVTDITPPLTIEGLSPDCQDIVFIPGNVKQREGLAKLFALAFNNHPLYQKTFVQPNENPLNLFITAANGANLLYQEDVNAAPGIRTQIASLPAAGLTCAQSATAFGREYIAVSDGRHGVHVPLQYDGTNLDRVSQDGPGAAVTLTEENVTYAIASAFSGVTNNITSISQSGNTVTAVATSAMSAEMSVFPNYVGQQVKIAGVGSGYDGTYTILSYSYLAGVITVTFFATSGLPVLGAGGTMQFAIAAITLSVANPFVSGNRVNISGSSVAGYNGSATVQAGSITFGRFYIFVTTFGLGASVGGLAAVSGNIGPGTHACVVMFLTRQGYITKPSPTVSWTTTTGNRIIVSNIPIGPANVLARILAFTGAGGARYFYIPINFTLPGTTTPIQTTVIADNTSTSATVDFSDNALFGATSIDVQGRNYFAQVVLGEVLGFFAYASRLFTWGEIGRAHV